MNDARQRCTNKLAMHETEVADAVKRPLIALISSGRTCLFFAVFRLFISHGFDISPTKTFRPISQRWALGLNRRRQDKYSCANGVRVESMWCAQIAPDLFRTRQCRYFTLYIVCCYWKFAIAYSNSSAINFNTVNLTLILWSYMHFLHRGSYKCCSKFLSVTLASLNRF